MMPQNFFILFDSQSREVSVKREKVNVYGEIWFSSRNAARKVVLTILFKKKKTKTKINCDLS